MTVGAWLQSRTPLPPPTLLAGVIDALGSRAGLDARETPAIALDAAVALLESLLRQDPLGRDRAAELLAADALVTYALESAATLTPDLDDFAAAAMTRLAELASDSAARE